MVVSAAFLDSDTSNADFVWRIVLMFGAVPATLTYYWRMKMPETARYTALVAKDAKKAASDMLHFRRSSSAAMVSTSWAPACAGSLST